MLLKTGISILQEKARDRNVNGYVLVIRQVLWQTREQAAWWGTADPYGFVPWLTPAVLCAVVVSMGGAAGTIQARQSDQVVAQPDHLSLEKFFLNHQPSCGFSGIGFLSAEHPTCWRMSEHGLLLCRWQILRLTSVGGCSVRCTEPSHCQEVVLAFAHAQGYFTECHHLIMKHSSVTMAHRNSLCP